MFINDRKKHNISTFILLLIPLLNITLLQAKIKEDPQKKMFDSLYFVVHTDSKNIYKHGQYLLSIAKTDLQTARAYNIIGDGLYKQGRYLEAVDVLEKGNQYAIKAKNDYWRMYIINLLIRTYKYTGLNDKAEEYYKILEQLDLQNKKDKIITLNQARALMYEIDKDYCKGAEYRNKSLDLFISQFKHEPLSVSKNFIIPGKVLYMYDLVKCGDLAGAEKQLNEVDEIIKFANEKENFNFVSYYFLTKAHLNISKGGNPSVSKNYLSRAYEEVLKTNITSLIKSVVEDILSTGLMSIEEQKKYYSKLVEIGDKKSKQQMELVSKVISDKDNEIEKQNRQEAQVYYFGGSVAVIAASTFAYLMFRKHKRKKEIAEDGELNLEYQKQSKDTTLNENKERIISEELELEILKNLKAFEAKQLFLNKDILVSTMASKLKTTHRNLTYILKKHRDNDFNNYINECRINYIIQELTTDKKLRNYKIAALADLCGYKTHSQFTMVFKNKKGISPSQFIEELNKFE